MEIEAFAVIESMSALGFITALREAHIFTDHVSQTFLSDPFDNNPSIHRQFANILISCTFTLSPYRHVKEYLPGEESALTDILTRLGPFSTAAASKATTAALYDPVDMGTRDYEIAYIRAHHEMSGAEPEKRFEICESIKESGLRKWENLNSLR